MTPNLFNPYRYATGGALDAVYVAGSTTSWWTATTHFQIHSASTGTFSSGTSTLTSRYFVQGRGNSTDCIKFGGGSDTGANNSESDCQTWDNVSWTSRNTMNAASAGHAGGGNTSDAFWCGQWGGGGATPSNTTGSWNGTSWTSEAAVSVTGRFPNGDGNSSSFIKSGGDGDPPPRTDTETYNGSSWSSGTSYTGSYNFQAYGSGGAGTPTEFIGLNNGTDLADQCYAYNGTSWTVRGTFNGTHKVGSLGGSSPDASAIAMQGNTVADDCDVWDGATWSASGSLVSSVLGGGGGMNA